MELFPEYQAKPAPIKAREDNTKKRNDRIIARSKELHDVKRLRWDDVLQKLHEEFFLSKLTISRIIADKKSPAN